MSLEMYDNYVKEIEDKPSVESVVNQINELISSEKLTNGDKLPSERILSEKFNVGRMFVRDALRKLEFYGIIKKNAQGGRVVLANKDSAFTAMVGNALSLTNPSYESLLEARFVLEVESAGLAAERRDQDNINDLNEVLALLGNKVSEGEAGIEEDLLFHVRVAEASKNEVIKYFVSFLVTHMRTFSKEFDICRNSRNLKAYNEHVIILEHIKNGDKERAKQAMKEHLSSLFEFVK